MPEMDLKQPAFTHSTCGPFTKNKERIQKFKQTGDSRYIYKYELNEACGDFKDLAKRTAADNVLRNKAFRFAKDPIYDGYQRGLASMAYNFFDKKTTGSGIKSLQQSEQF